MAGRNGISSYAAHYFCPNCYNENNGKPTGNWVPKEKAVEDNYCPACGHQLRKKPKGGRPWRPNE
jgi:hypothetical protein